MIGFLKGKIFDIEENSCLLDVNGVGYRIFTTKKICQQLHHQEEVFFFTHLSVREDALTLYGFLSKEEYEFFQQLISVSGIGAKGALSILSSISVSELFSAVMNEDIGALLKLSGIGKKTAQRLLFELKEKFSKMNRPIDDDVQKETIAIDKTIFEEGAAALMSLGYTQQEISKVMRFARDKNNHLQTTSDVIKFCLKLLNKK